MYVLKKAQTHYLVSCCNPSPVSIGRGPCFIAGAMADTTSDQPAGTLKSEQQELLDQERTAAAIHRKNLLQSAFLWCNERNRTLFVWCGSNSSPFRHAAHLFGPLIVGAVAIPVHTYFCHRALYLPAAWTTPYEPLQWLLATGALVMLILTNQVDPGTVPSAVEDAGEDCRNGERRGEDTWCALCGVWRPPLAKHCKECERCFFEVDHHCGLMGTCIAQSTMGFFNGFLLFVALAGALPCVLGFQELWELRLTYTASFPCCAEQFYITGFFLMGGGPMFVGCLWMALGMYGFLTMNLFQWAQKHQHSMPREFCHMFTHPIRWREFAAPQKCGYEPMHAHTSTELSVLNDEVLQTRGPDCEQGEMEHSSSGPSERRKRVMKSATNERSAHRVEI